MRSTHSEEEPLSFVCQVNLCPMLFHNTNTWYKHVVNTHREDYIKTFTASQSSDQEDSSSAEEQDNIIAEEEDNSLEDDSIAEEEDHNEGPMDLEMLTGLDDTVNTSSSAKEAPTCISKEEVAGKLIRLKEKHMLSHAAVDEVVELVKMVCDSTVTSVLSEAVRLGEACDLDMNSDFFKQLPSIFDTLSFPLSRIETTFRQQSYVAKNLPYVVS